MSQVGQFNFEEAIETLTGNTGDVVHPQVGNVYILGSGHISVNGNNTTGALTITADGGLCDTVTTDSGSAAPVLGILRILGGNNINTAGTGNTVTVHLDDSIILPVTNSLGTAGLYSLGSNRFMHARGTNNTFLGESAGSLVLTVASAVANTGIGANVMTAITSAAYNVGCGSSALTALTSGVTNTAIGALAGAYLNGSGNTLVGKEAGVSYVGTESYNICIGSSGSAGESNKIRIGGAYGTGSGQQDTAYITGVVHASNGLYADLGDIICTAGNITATAGNISATAGYIETVDNDLYIGDKTVALTGPDIQFKKSRGGAVITSGDVLGNIKFSGYDGTSYDVAAQITSLSSGTIGTGRVAADLQFWTSPDVAGIALRRMDVKPTGEVYIWTPDSGVGLTIQGRGETITSGDLLVSAGEITATNGDLTIGNTDTGATAPFIKMEKSRSGGAITSGDALAEIDFYGDDGTGNILAAAIKSFSSGTIATNRVAGNLEFYTHPDSTSSASKRVEIKTTGEVTIAAPDSGTALTVTGTVAATTFDTNVVAAGVTLTGTTLSADGTDTDININITAKGTGQVIIDDLQLGTPLTVQYGGTGASSLTDHGLLAGSGTSAITALSVGSSGQLLTGVTSSDPTWTTATYPSTVNKGDVLVASANNVVDIVAGATTAGHVLMANGATLAPTFQALPSSGVQTLAGDSGTATGSTVTIAGGTNIGTSATGSTVTVDLDNSITLSGDVTALNLKTSTVATNLTLNGNTITSDGSGTDIDINLVAKGAGGLTFDGISTGYSDSQWHLRQEELQTTDATPTALVSIALVEGEMITINATINGFQSDFTDACGATCVMTCYRPTGGNVTQVGEEIINVNSTSTAVISADVNVGTQSMIIYAAGVAAETWNWVSTHQYMFTKTNA